MARTSGIMLDPVYTGKAVKGLLHEVKVNPTRFKGQRILFIHTGMSKGHTMYKFIQMIVLVNILYLKVSEACNYNIMCHYVMLKMLTVCRWSVWDV